MNEERRAAERVRTNLAARWEGAFTDRVGTVVDISMSGCFLLSEDAVRPAELIRLEFELPTGRRIRVWGRVVNQFPEIGFALRFESLDAAERKMVEALIEFSRDAGGAQAL
jgi:RNase P/RNase MRP subunit p29